MAKAPVEVSEAAQTIRDYLNSGPDVINARLIYEVFISTRGEGFDDFTRLDEQLRVFIEGVE